MEEQTNLSEYLYFSPYVFLYLIQNLVESFFFFHVPYDLYDNFK